MIENCIVLVLSLIIPATTSKCYVIGDATFLNDKNDYEIGHRCQSILPQQYGTIANGSDLYVFNSRLELDTPHSNHLGVITLFKSTLSGMNKIKAHTADMVYTGPTSSDFAQLLYIDPTTLKGLHLRLPSSQKQKTQVCIDFLKRSGHKIIYFSVSTNTNTAFPEYVKIYWTVEKVEVSKFGQNRTTASLALMSDELITETITFFNDRNGSNEIEINGINLEHRERGSTRYANGDSVSKINVAYKRLDICDLIKPQQKTQLNE